MTLAKEAKSSALIDNVAVSANSASALSTMIDTSNAIQVAVEVLYTIGSVPTKCVRLDCYGSMDDTNYTTSPFASYDCPLPTAAGTFRHEFGIANAMRYIKFKVADTDTSVTISSVCVYAQCQLVT